MKKEYLEAGKIVNTHGIKGEVKIMPYTDFPELLCEFDRLFLDKKEIFIERSRVAKNMVIAKIEGIDTPEQAEKLRNKILYMHRDDLELDDDTYFIQDLIGIEVKDVSTDSFKAYLMIIDDPSRVDLVVGKKVPTVGSTTSQIVESYNAVAGINAGGLADDAAGTGAMPTGLLMVNGEYFDNEFNYYQSVSMCGFTQDNILYVSDNITKSQIDNLNLRCAISFGPVLIVNGQPRISSGSGWGIQPRTCIGQRQDGAVLFLVIDGRQTDSLGATLKNAQDILLNNGAYNAFNLDGGASSTMVFDGSLVNKPSDIAGERYVPTAFIVK